MAVAQVIACNAELESKEQGHVRAFPVKTGGELKLVEPARQNRFNLSYCFSRSMDSYSWRAMPARIWAGVQPALVL